MERVRNRLLGYGITLCLAGIAFRMAATTLLASIYSTLPSQQPLGAVIIEFISTVVASCVVPLGTAMIAISIALRMLAGRIILAASPDAVDQP